MTQFIQVHTSTIHEYNKNLFKKILVFFRKKAMVSGTYKERKKAIKKESNIGG